MAYLTDEWPKKSKPNGHPMDGTILSIQVGDGAYMDIPDPRARGGLYSDVKSIGWHLTWGEYEDARYCAAGLLESYAYLLSGSINQKEAMRRLRIMRAAWKEAVATGSKQPEPMPNQGGR